MLHRLLGVLQGELYCSVHVLMYVGLEILSGREIIGNRDMGRVSLFVIQFNSVR